MYSILIELSDNKYKYYLNADNEIWSGNLQSVKTMYTQLLAEHPAGKLKVVHNTTIDLSTIDISDVE